MATCNTDELLALTGCCDKYSQHDLLRIIAGAICQLFQLIDPMASCDFSSLLTDTNTLAGKSQHDLLRIIAGGICEILQSGGIGGQTCLLCGDVPPVDDPNCTCALYQEKPKGAIWQWNDDTSQWELIFSLVP